MCSSFRRQRKRKIAERETQMDELKEKKKNLEAAIANASKGKEDSVCFAK